MLCTVVLMQILKRQWKIMVKETAFYDKSTNVTVMNFWKVHFMMSQYRSYTHKRIGSCYYKVLAVTTKINEVQLPEIIGSPYSSAGI